MYGVLDSSCWHKRGDTGPSLAEQMVMVGCRWRPSDRSGGSRIAGKNEIHRRLQDENEDGNPSLVVFDTCFNIVSQFPSIPLDKKNPEDVDTKSEDHLYDAIRYGIMSRPRHDIFDYDPMSQTDSFAVADQTFGY
jgi:phage terminase large subunit